MISFEHFKGESWNFKIRDKSINTFEICISVIIAYKYM